MSFHRETIFSEHLCPANLSTWRYVIIFIWFPSYLLPLSYQDASPTVFQSFSTSSSESFSMY